MNATGTATFTFPFGDEEPITGGNEPNPCTLGRFLLYSAGGAAKPCGSEREPVLGPVVRPNGQAVRDRALQKNGILDLAGSVAEWTLDPWDRNLHENGGSPALATNANANVFPTRGGSFRSGPRFVRGYARVPVDDALVGTREDTLLAVGFRCVKR